MKILLITYYFPPCGGAAVQRWLRFCRYLLQRGIAVTVLSSLGGDYPFTDPSLMAKLPTGLKVIRAKAPGMQKVWKRLSRSKSSLPYGDIAKARMGIMAKILVWLRLNFIYPDLRVFWNPAAYRAALNELSRDRYDVIISTGPPHSTHFIAYKLFRKLGLDWYTDFRDPWLDIHYLKLNPPSRLSRYIHKRMESKILQSAKGNFIISEAIADSLPPADKTILYNGYDPLDFQALEHHPSSLFRVKYVGQLTAGQDPDLFVKLSQALTREHELSFIGTELGDDQLLQLRSSLGNRLRHISFCPHAEALQEMVDSDLLILIINEYSGNKGVLTTKLFEYLAAGSPILCFGPADGAAAKVIQDTSSGITYSPQEISEAANWVNKLVPGHRNEGNIERYSVATQIDTLISKLQS